MGQIHDLSDLQFLQQNMINVQPNPHKQMTHHLFAPHIAKRKLNLNQHTTCFINPKKTSYSELRCNKSCPQIQIQKSPPYNQLKNKLLSYLNDNQKHSKKEPKQLESQGLSVSCGWFDNKKQYNNQCKNQTPHQSKQPHFLKKNIKRYISEAKHRKKSLKTTHNEQTAETHTVTHNQSTNVIKQTRAGISIVVSKKETPTLQQLLPIHHTRAYFYDKQPPRKPYNPILDSPFSGQLSIERQVRYCSEYSSIQLSEQKPQSPLRIYVDQEEQDQQFEGKFQQHQKFLNIKGRNFKFHPKKKLCLGRSQNLKQDELQANEISPWKRRRNTVDSQPAGD